MTEVQTWKKEFENYTKTDIVHLKSVKSDVLLKLVSIWMVISGCSSHVLYLQQRSKGKDYGNQI